MKSRTTDEQARLAAHAFAMRKRDRWAIKARDLLAAGKAEAAKEALAKADEWAERMRQLDPDVRTKT